MRSDAKRRASGKIFSRRLLIGAKTQGFDERNGGWFLGINLVPFWIAVLRRFRQAWGERLAMALVHAGRPPVDPYGKTAAPVPFWIAVLRQAVVPHPFLLWQNLALGALLAFAVVMMMGCRRQS